MAAFAATSQLAPLLSRRSIFQPTRLVPITYQLPALAFAPLTALGAGLLQNLIDLFPPFLLAVPKKKVSHSRKSMRSANKGLKDKLNIVNCPACGAAKLSHHLCGRCYSRMEREWKAKHRESQV